MPGQFSVQPLVRADLSEALEALSDAFGRGFDEQWYDWKHQSGPFGNSWAWVARDDRGLLGLRILLPWRFVGPAGPLDAARPCDTVTVPRARGKGVFRSLTEYALDQLSGRVDLLFNTPNENSRPGYLKMGFQQWGSVRTRYAFVRHDKSRLVTDIAEPVEPMAFTETSRSDAFFDWRYRRCPVYEYQSFSLQNAEHENGAVVRIRTTRGRRVVVFSELWGDPPSRQTLVRTVCHTMGSRLALLTEKAVSSPLSLSGNETIVTHKPLGATNPGSARFSIGDVEDVI